jgi:hypothetical protein
VREAPVRVGRVVAALGRPDVLAREVVAVVGNRPDVDRVAGRDQLVDQPADVLVIGSVPPPENEEDSLVAVAELGELQARGVRCGPTKARGRPQSSLSPFSPG